MRAISVFWAGFLCASPSSTSALSCFYRNLIPFCAHKGLTRALEGGRLCPHLFFANNLKTTARSAAKFDIPAHNSRRHLVCKF